MNRINFSALLLLALLAAAAFLAPDPAFAQSINIDAGDGAGSTTGRIVQLILLITVLSLAPSILMMMTSFLRIIIVLSFVRMAIGTQSTPPNQVIVGLAMFLTLFVMMPTFQKSYQDGIQPLINEQITEQEAIPLAAAPFHGFMMEHVREKDLRLFMDMQDTKVERPQDTPFQVLIPAFMISELKRAFEIGFLIFVPFLIIDMVVASVLMAMGMMMLPPVVISLPFKIIFFVMVDGWYMLAGSLVRSFSGGAG